jgi:hypothetical protein
MLPRVLSALRIYELRQLDRELRCARVSAFSSMLYRFIRGVQFAQKTEPLLTAEPQMGHRGLVSGIAGTLLTRLPAFAVLRFVWVSLWAEKGGMPVEADLVG